MCNSPSYVLVLYLIFTKVTINSTKIAQFYRFVGSVIIQLLFQLKAYYASNEIKVINVVMLNCWV
jgi:hypothetical protein